MSLERDNKNYYIIIRGGEKLLLIVRQCIYDHGNNKGLSVMDNDYTAIGAPFNLSTDAFYAANNLSKGCLDCVYCKKVPCESERIAELRCINLNDPRLPAGTVKYQQTVKSVPVRDGKYTIYYKATIHYLYHKDYGFFDFKFTISGYKVEEK